MVVFALRRRCSRHNVQLDAWIRGTAQLVDVGPSPETSDYLLSYTC